MANFKLSGDLEAVSVIMAGGSGTRFWPLSRKDKPKQYLSLTDAEPSLIQQTARRMSELSGDSGVLVLTGEAQRHLVEEHLPGVAVLAEPCARNTAPCLGLAALEVLDQLGDLPMVCVPADHVIENESVLVDIFRQAVEYCREEDVLITVGIEPSGPETGYGYIRTSERSAKSIMQVEQFVEKPDLETAKEYVESGQYFWNAGMFVWRPSVLLAQFEKYLPDCLARLKSMQAQNVRQRSEIFASITPISIDFGVMEKAENVKVIAGTGFRWNDVGSWSAWAEVLEETGKEVCSGELVQVDCRNNLILGGKRLIACIGMEDIVIVDTEDAVLVCPKGEDQKVKEVVEVLKEKGYSRLL